MERRASKFHIVDIEIKKVFHNQLLERLTLDTVFKARDTRVEAKICVLIRWSMISLILNDNVIKLFLCHCISVLYKQYIRLNTVQ